MRIFYTDDGKMYKAEKPSSPTHAEMNFPTQDILDVMTDVPCTREDMIARINHPDFPKKQAVLADERDKKATEILEAEKAAVAALEKAKEKEKTK